MTAEHTLDLPALSVEALEESALHLPAVSGLRPASGFLAALDRNQAVRAQVHADEGMHFFGITSAIPKHTPNAHAAGGFQQNFRRLQRVAARSNADLRAQHEVAVNVNATGQLGPARNRKTFVTALGTKIMRGMSYFEACAIAGHLNACGDQFPKTGAADELVKKCVDRAFFKSLVSARHNVEYVGTSFKPRHARRSDHSRSNSSTPR